MRVLVTGSEGVIGRRLCTELISHGHDVFGVDLMHTDGGNLKGYMRADISQAEQLVIAINKFNPHIVYNLAAEFGRHNGEAYSAQLWNSNVVGMKHLLLLQKAYGFKLIHASSSEVYGEGPWDRPSLDEGMTNRVPLFHHNDYAMSKWVNEQQIRNYLRSNPNGDVVTLRFFNSYGPGEEYHPYRSVVCLFCYHALFQLPITVYEGYHRVFMHMDDFIPTLAKTHGLPSGEVMNIGGDEYRSVLDLFQIIEDYMGGGLDVRYLSQDAHNTVNKRPNIEKARRLLGHGPKVKLEEGVIETLEWMKERYAA